MGLSHNKPMENVIWKMGGDERIKTKKERRGKKKKKRRNRVSRKW